jgi:hypothetical protein
MALWFNFNQTNYDGTSFKPMGKTGDAKTTDQTIVNALAGPGTNSGQVGMIAASNSGWSFRQVQVPFPSNLNYKNPSTLGTLKATESLFDGVSCPDPQNNQFLLNASPASIMMPILYPKTN